MLGGVSTTMLADAYPDAPVFRLMPNTAVEVGRGVILYTPGARRARELESRVLALFERLGIVVRIGEEQIAAATAISGVGPAYQALLAEAQVDAAVRRGLAPAVAAQLVTETMAGTAALLQAREYDTLAVRRDVTSPGGSTARGLAALERAGIRSAFQDAADSVIGWSAS